MAHIKPNDRLFVGQSSTPELWLAVEDAAPLYMAKSDKNGTGLLADIGAGSSSHTGPGSKLHTQATSAHSAGVSGMSHPGAKNAALAHVKAAFGGASADKHTTESTKHFKHALSASGPEKVKHEALSWAHGRMATDKHGVAKSAFSPPHFGRYEPAHSQKKTQEMPAVQPTHTVSKVGTTGSGKQIMGPTAEHVSHHEAHAQVSKPSKGQAMQHWAGKNKFATAHVKIHGSGFSKQDHHDAAAAHTAHAAKHAGTGVGKAHSDLSAAHTNAAGMTKSLPELWLPLE